MKVASHNPHMSEIIADYRGAFMTQGEKIKAVAKILKSHFTNLTVEQTIDMAVEIVQALE